MFGAQASWSRAFGEASVYVAQADRAWVQREDSSIRSWNGDFEVRPGVTLRVVGDPFPAALTAGLAGPPDGR